MPDAAQNAESAPAAPSTFEEYLSLKTQTPSETSEAAHSPEEEKAVPASEPEEPVQEKTELTDEEKAERKHRNDKRREQRWFEERGAMRAELERHKQELAEIRAAQKTESAPVTAGDEPALQTFLDSGKYQTYEDAQAAWMRAVRAYDRDTLKAELKAEQQKERQQETAKTVHKTFKEQVKDYSKSHPGFDDAFDVVAERLDSDAKFLSDAIVRSGNVALIDHLGKNEDLIDSLVDLPQSVALLELGKIAASIAKAAPEEPKTQNPLPRAPKAVGARHNPPSRDTALRQAAESGDFTAFQAANRKRG